MAPISGLMDHTTPVLVVPVTAAVNCWLWPAPNVTVEGLTVMPIAELTCKVAVRVTPPWLANSVTVDPAVAEPTCAENVALPAPDATVTLDGMVTATPLVLV